MRLLVIGDGQEFISALHAALAGSADAMTWRSVASVNAAGQWLAHHAAPALIVLRAVEADRAGTVVATADRLVPRVPVLVAGEGMAAGDMLGWLRLGVAGCLPLPSPPAMARAAVGTLTAGGRYIPPDMLERMIGALHHELALDDIDDNGEALLDAALGASEESALLGISRRQYEILALLTRGLSIKSICQRLLISEGTAKTHVSALYRRLGARNRGEAIYIAAQRGAKRLFDR